MVEYVKSLPSIDMGAAAVSLDIPQGGGSYLSFLQRCWEMSYAGSDVAAHPEMKSDGFWPHGEPVAGAAEAADAFRYSLFNRDVPHLIFFVGGPGNGKSWLCSQVVRDLAPLPESHDSAGKWSPAKRRYRYSTPTLDLLVINDATIGQVSGASVLATEIDEVLSTPSHLIASVNRGVIVEEVACVGEGTARVVLEFVQSGMWHGRLTPMPHQSEYLRQATLDSETGAPSLITVVLMDRCSLLEARPVSAFTQDLLTTAGKYEISPFSDRLKLDSNFVAPANDLYEEFFKRALAAKDGASIGRRDPFAANIQSLSSPQVAHGVLGVLRASEIAASRLLSYRDLWAVCVRLILGDFTEHSKPTELGSWLETEVGSEDSEAGAEFESMCRLASYRFHQTLFESRDSNAANNSSHPILRLTHRADPIRDARAGRSTPTNIQAAEPYGWATPLLDVFAGLAPDSSPLSNLLLVSKNAAFAASVTDFEHELDTAFVSLMNSSNLDDKTRSEAISWYSRYLVRLYAVANGIPAFWHEIDTWIRMWRSAGAVGAVDLKIAEAMKTVIAPIRTAADSLSGSVLAAFDARASAVVGAQDLPRLGLRIATQSWQQQLEREGDRLRWRLRESSEVVFETDFDFSLMRELLASNAGSAGITDEAVVIAPRIERFRAALMRPELYPLTPFVVIDDEKELLVNLAVDGE